MKKKEVNTYSRATLPVSVKNRNDYADYDYLDQLSNKELKWLKGFNREYVNADFKHSYTKIIKDKKSCYTLNNTRNRCLYNKLKVEHMLLFSYDVGSKSNKIEHPDKESYERYLILKLDHK